MVREVKGQILRHNSPDTAFPPPPAADRYSGGSWLALVKSKCRLLIATLTLAPAEVGGHSALSYFQPPGGNREEVGFLDVIWQLRKRCAEVPLPLPMPVHLARC